MSARNDTFNEPIMINHMVNDGQESNEQTNTSFSLSTLIVAKELLDEERRIKSAKEIQQELLANLRKIRENIPRPKGVKHFFKRFIESRKTKSFEKKLAKNPDLETEISETVLDETKGGPCEKLLPARDENGKLFTDYELRMKVRMNLDDLTSWPAVKEAFCSGMENPKKIERCHKMAEKLHFIEEEDKEADHDEEEDDEDENEVGLSTRPIMSGDAEVGEAESRESAYDDKLDDALLEAAAARKKSEIELLVQARRSLDFERRSSNSAASSGELQKAPLLKRSSTTSANGININHADKTSISSEQKMVGLSAKKNHQLQRSKTTASPKGIDIVRKTLLIFNEDSSKSGKSVQKQKQAKQKMDKLHNGQKARKKWKQKKEI
ncbi:hypothetical protein niasHS_015877 [Heterodera schachtii]|uniref:Uncharacterized protein n=1 Tax=Heterodera schachtii TaxID=97005 RepID=A0ABD2I021_HETSC